MCRSIKVLRRPGEPATIDELNSAALQFVRKISGFRKPSQANQEAFDRAVREISLASDRLLKSIEASAPGRKRAANNRAPATLAAVALLILGGACANPVHAQTVDSGFVYGGVTFGKRLDGAGRFGVGLDFHLSPQFDLGGEIGTIHKHDVGILASGNLTYHFNRPRRREEWDPFLSGGLTGARISGVGGLYVNLGAGVNYWVTRRFALRGEFKGYPGGQDLGGFAELRFGVTFRP